MTTVTATTLARSALCRLAITELRLYLRDTAAVVLTVAHPIVILLALGAIPALRTPDETFGGVRFIDVYAPALLAVIIATIGLVTLPIGLVTYRERGVLRRFATTPMRPPALLGVQLGIAVGTAVASAALLVVVAHLVFAVPLPRHPLDFLLTFAAGTAAVFAIGLVVAATARKARTATGIGMGMLVFTLFLSGIYLPKFLLPDVLVRIGDYIPPATGALQDAWTGATGPPLPQLVAMAAIAVVAAAVASRLFRWE